MSGSPLLSVEGVDAGYGDIQVLQDVSLSVGEREIVAVVGANGAGKTTLLSTIAGLVRRTRGRVVYDGQDFGAMPAHAIVARGVVTVPEGGRLFPFMTVRENLELGAFGPQARARLAESMEEAMELFPVLAQRRDQLAGSLSGGERQMCAIARAMMARPRLLMLDEPSLGLSPLMVEKIFDLLLRLTTAHELAVLLVEQNVGEALAMASRGYVVERGRIVKSGAGQALLEDADVQRAYMGI